MMDGDQTECTICRDSTRDTSLLCVVEDYLDMIAIERVGIFKGKYHVLGGSISPIHGVMPTNLTIAHLFERIEEMNIEEIILAMNPNIEGEATTLYITENIPKKEIKITRLSK